MSKRSFRTALAVVIGTIVLLIALCGWFVHRALAYPDARHAGTGQDVEIEVKTGMGFPQVATMLAQKGVIDRPTWFRLYAMWEGDTTNVKTGKYLIKDNLTPAEVLKILIAGVKEVTAKVTIPEGKNMLEVFALLDGAHIANAAELELLARDKDFLAQHAITGDSVEGYLFPDTYEFRVGEKPRTVLERMITRHEEVWNDLLAKHGRDAAALKEKLGWTDRDILIMASIVEKEAVDPAERPRITQVFVNRLLDESFKPHYLATDPTIRYGCEVPVQKSAACAQWDRAGRLHALQLHDKDNPYNTYTHEGLPPGPICNPGRASLEATLTPDGSDYLYFVAKNARNHVFARTQAEHDKNVQKYQK
ncbi:MAG TPA: endolytic transglycosylase MltG [Kofleriaceae bacterium]|nr:endolytic transglycosylase MltG [Kofleriaceae bacterium]